MKLKFIFHCRGCNFFYPPVKLLLVKAGWSLLFAIPVIVNAQFTTYNAGQAFTCITVDSNSNIWAGTSKAGIYMLDKKSNPNAKQLTIVSSGSISTYNIQTLAADQFNNVWVGHNGLANTGASGGGIERYDINNPTVEKHYLTDANAECLSFVARDGLASSNSASIAVDKNGTVWSAHKYHDLFVSGLPPDIPAQYILTPGSLSYKPATSTSFISKGTYQDFRIGADAPELPYPAYTCNPSISQTAQSRNCYSVASGSSEVWVSVAAYTAKNGSSFPARILKYDLAGVFQKSYDFVSIGIPAGGIFSSVYVSSKGDVWVSLSAGKGFAVLRKGQWYASYNNPNISCIFPAGTVINSNAIWGNKLGQVFLGTNNGLVVYNGTGQIGSSTSYTLYTTQNNSLLSNNVIAGASERDTTQWIVTDKGIISSTLGRNFPSSVNEIDYTSCGNMDINAIEAQSSQDLSLRKDYHYYKVETVICNQSGPNGSNCNAQYIYKMMKDSVKYTTPTVADFPYDNLQTALLINVSKSDLNNIMTNVNAWQTNKTLGNENGGIKEIRQVLTQPLINLYYGTLGKGKIPFVDGIFLGSRADYAAKQSANPTNVISCTQVYKLYNSPNFIVDRAGFNYTLAFLPFGCDHLTSNEYDEVRIFADDINLTFSNYTERGHFLYPGKVVRSVIEECGQVKIVTIGTGLSSCGSGFRGLMNGNGNVITGSILFKNIDLRLKDAFEKSH